MFIEPVHLQFHIPRAESARGIPQWGIVCYTHLTPLG